MVLSLFSFIIMYLDPLGGFIVIYVFPRYQLQIQTWGIALWGVELKGHPNRTTDKTQQTSSQSQCPVSGFQVPQRNMHSGCACRGSFAWLALSTPYLGTLTLWASSDTPICAAHFFCGSRNQSKGHPKRGEPRASGTPHQAQSYFSPASELLPWPLLAYLDPENVLLDLPIKFLRGVHHIRTKQGVTLECPGKAPHSFGQMPCSCVLGPLVASSFFKAASATGCVRGDP